MDYWLEVTGSMVQNGVIEKIYKKGRQMQVFYAALKKTYPNFVQVIPITVDWHMCVDHSW